MQTRAVPRATQKTTAAARPTAPRRSSGVAAAAAAPTHRVAPLTNRDVGAGVNKVSPVKVTKKPVATVTATRQPHPPPQRYPLTNPKYDEDDDSDGYASSDDSMDSAQFNSEQFQPLAFTLIRGGPTRAIGGIASSTYSMRVMSPEAIVSDSDSELSVLESPLPVYYHANDAKRFCGGVRRSSAAENVVSVMSVDDSSISSRALPVTIEQRKRARSVGPMPSKGLLENKESQEPRSVPAGSDDDEAPLNADVILNLVRRVRDPTTKPEDIPLEAFQVVNWDDDMFQAELEPLKKLYEYLEAMATLKKTVATPAMKAQKQSQLQAKIKEAVMELPTEKAMVVKAEKVKNNALKSAPAKSVLLKGQFGEKATGGAIGPKDAWNGASDVPRGGIMKNGRRSSTGDPDSGDAAASPVNDGAKRGLENAQSAQPTKKTVKGNALASSGLIEVRPVEAGKTKEAAAASGKKKKMKDSLLLSANSLGASVREGQMNASMSELFKPNTKAMSAQKTNKHVVKESTMTEEPNRVRKALAKKKKNNAGRSVSFTDIPALDASEVVDDVVEPQIEKPQTASEGEAAASKAGTRSSQAGQNKKNRERPKGIRRSHLGQSVSFASIPDEPGGEIKEDAPSKLEPDTKGAKAAAVPRRKRMARSQNNRSCSFSDVNLDEAKEIRDDQVAAQPLSRPPSSLSRPVSSLSRPVSSLSRPVSSVNGNAAEAAGGNGKKAVLRRRPVPRKSKRELEMSAPDLEQADEIKDDEGGAGTGDKKKKNRRNKNSRKCEVSFSVIEDDVAGEIYENPADNAYLGNATPAGSNDAGRGFSRPISRQTTAPPAAASTKSAANEPKPQKPDTKAPPSAKRRRKRISASRELSISAIPEEEAGEIHEHPDLLLELPATSHRSSVSHTGGQKPQPKGTATVLPRLPQKTDKK